MGRRLDYYRQFEGLSEEEVNRVKRKQADERKRRALERVTPLDLSSTTWPTLPHPYVVNAVTFAARRGLHRYPSTTSNELRSELAHRHGLAPEQVAVGNGAAQLLRGAVTALMEPGQELITPWPSYPLYPLLARQARGRAVAVVSAEVDSILAAVTEHSRVITLAHPNDPTGAAWSQRNLDRLLSALPERVVVLLDEALVDFVEHQPLDASLALLERHPRLLVFRSFSKAWGLAGLRCGYALGAPEAHELLGGLEPDLGIGELAQAGALESLRSGAAGVAKRVRTVAAERERLAGSLRERRLEVADSQANFLWVAHPSLDGPTLAHELERSGVIVASGAALGASERVRISVRDGAAGDRLLAALDAVAARL